MPNQTTVFDQCRTLAEIQAQLQRLALELLATLQPHQAGSGQAAAEVAAVADLRRLAELSYGELKAYDHPVLLLSEICRLLFKVGDKLSLEQGLALSHIIYTFKCRHNESWYVSYLYKGIAQVGLGLTDIGIKNVVIGLTKHKGFTLVPIDRALGYWALMSAMITRKNLKAARTLAEKWRCAAQEGALPGEIFRARLTVLLFQILAGELETCAQTIAELAATAPAAWQPTVDFFLDWMTAIAEGKCPEMAAVADPYPLLLGVNWHPSRDPNSFSMLCELRRNLCNQRAQQTLSAQELETYATIMAEWELPRPLCEFETLLKACGEQAFFQFNLTRLLGKPVLEKLLHETPLDANIITRQQAVIWVMDVRKFSKLSEKRTPEHIFDLLNPVFKIISAELESVGGTILEFIGDSLVIVFNTFHGQHTDMAAILFHTIRCLQRIYVLNAMSKQTTLPDIRIGVGVNRGPVALGYLGGLQRCHLTVLGNTINLAARLEAASKELPGDVIVSAACFDQRSPTVWATPLQVNFSLRDLGPEHLMRNISKPVHLFGVSPLIRYWVDFVAMGFVAQPEKGVVYLDTGNSDKPGIIDHHFERKRANSACELLIRHPELLRRHLDLAKTSPSRIEFRLHTMPDLDCAATLYVAQEFLDRQPREALLQKLAAYVSDIDRAIIPQPERLSDSLYGIFLAHQMFVKQHAPDKATDLALLEAGLRVVDAALYLLEQHPEDGDLAAIFQFQPDWFAEEKRMLADDQKRYADDLQQRSHPYRAHVHGLPEPVAGIWLDHPQSMFHTFWAYHDPNAPGGNGYKFLALDLSQPDRQRFLIGVPPETGVDINGLGQLLEQHETRKRKELGKERAIHPIRPPADNSDPWYFGQGHSYTVIDAPGQGTVLTAAEVQQIHESWQGSGR